MFCSNVKLEYCENMQAVTDIILNDRSIVNDTAILLSNVMLIRL